MSRSQNFNVLVIDDHEMVLKGVKATLKGLSCLHSVDCISSAELAISEIHINNKFDLILIDIHLPGMDGIVFTQKLKMEYPEIKVLVYTLYSRKEFMRAIMDAGADGYVLKSSSSRELIFAVEEICAGKTYFSPQAYAPPAAKSGSSGIYAPVPLSVREKEVVKLIYEGLNSAQIAAKLEVTKHTVDAHRKKILSKIGGKNIADIISFGLKSGIIKFFH